MRYRHVITWDVTEGREPATACRGARMRPRSLPGFARVETTTFACGQALQGHVAVVRAPRERWGRAGGDPIGGRLDQRLFFPLTDSPKKLECFVP